MSWLIYVLAYLAVAVCIGSVVHRIADYLKKPLHLRWELYPVAHEAERASYGGSYLEEADWWQKDRKKSRIGELKVMIPEILLLKAVWEHNRPLWYCTYPFHLGLYLLIGFLGLLMLSAVLAIGGIAASAPIVALTNVAGPIGFAMCAVGAFLLIYKRATDDELNNYTTFDHYFNLAFFMLAMLVALLTWVTTDPNFSHARTFVHNLLTFNMAPMPNVLFALQVILIFLLMAYVPLTHMSHFFMKYFLYHDIRWGDEPNVNTPQTDKKIGIVLNYPVSWAAPHIAGDGKKTWAEVATFNPAAKPEAGKE